MAGVYHVGFHFPTEMNIIVSVLAGVQIMPVTNNGDTVQVNAKQHEFTESMFLSTALKTHYLFSQLEPIGYFKSVIYALV